MAASAREVALRCLLAGEKQGAWSDGYLRRTMDREGLSGADAGLCTRLSYGVMQNQMLLDYYIDGFSTIPAQRLESSVRDCLRLGLYQMLLMDRIPVHAAVNESVALAKRFSRSPKAGALVNAVLRSVDRARGEAGLELPEELAVRYSHPRWLVKEFSHTLPAEELEALLAADNAQPPIQAQINPLRTTQEDLARELREQGVGVKAHPWLSGCLELERTGNLEVLPAFREGRFYVQDAAARLAVTAAEPQPGMTVLDACAAPGGKTFAAAIAMKDRGRILARDLHLNKVKLIKAGAERLGLSCVTAQAGDARRLDQELEGRFDLAIADVPCSGLGIIRKKPDIRYKDRDALRGLPTVQADILRSVSRCVRPGGVLLYATCTLLRQENEDVLNAFLEENEAFSLEKFTLPGPIGETPGMVTLWPHRHGTDGFFIAKLRRMGG